MRSGAIRTGVLGALMTAALAAGASPASAAGVEACGSELSGAGSSLQGVAQKEVWIAGWGGGGCEVKPTVTYTATSSGKALEQWGAGKGVLGGAAGAEKPFPAFIASDVAPEGPAATEGRQLFDLDLAGKSLLYETPNAVLALPVAQSAIAIVISLPKGCKVEGATAPSVSSKGLQEEWETGRVAFKSLVEGAKLVGKSCEEVKTEGEALQPTLEARETASGTTAGLKRYLAEIGPEKNEYKTLAATAEAAENTTWPASLAKGQVDEKTNTTGSALAQKVLKTPGSIGYVDLADAVAAGFSASAVEKEGYESFFVRVQDNKRETKGEGAEYASPESEKASNCAGAEYSEAPAEVGPNADWSKVVDKNYEAGSKAGYPICTLTFALAWEWMTYIEKEGKPTYGAEAEAAAYEYLRYVVGTEAEAGGQSKALEEKRYAKLPSAIEHEAAMGLGLQTEAGEGAVKRPTPKEEAGEGPNKGSAWVASLGDSYISGEGGRWAGNMPGQLAGDALGTGAYWDNQTKTAEMIPGCHRSASAEIYIGVASGVNLACSGAQTTTQTHGGVIPGIDFYNIGGHEGQALLLEKLAKAHNIKMVALSIGGNNFGFANSLATCGLDWLDSYSSMTHTLCSNDTMLTKAFTPAEVTRQTAAILEAIKHVREAMSDAGYSEKMYSIVMQDYESIIPTKGSEFRYPQTSAARGFTGGCPIFDEDANWADTKALPRVNEAVQRAEYEAAGNVKLLNVELALVGRRLCETGMQRLGEVIVSGTTVNKWNQKNTGGEYVGVDLTEWVVQTIEGISGGDTMQESEHPSYWAQLALRNCLRQVYNNDAPVRGGLCVREGKGLTSEGEPKMKLTHIREYDNEIEGSATGKGHTFSLGTASAKCEEAIFKWTQTGLAPTLTVTPEYLKCTATGTGFTEAPTKVTTKECSYILTNPGETENHEAGVIIPSSCHIEVTVTVLGNECHVKAEGLQELKSIGLKNLKTTKGSFEGELKASVAGIAFSSSGTLCSLGGVPKEGTSEYKGSVVEKGVIVE